MVFVPQDLGFHPLELPDDGGFIIVVKSLAAPAPFSICRVTWAPLLASLGVVVLPRGSSKGTLNLRMGGRGCGGFIINPHIVQQHFAWEDRGPIGIATEIATDGQVHDEVERLVKWRRVGSAGTPPPGL